MKYFKTLIFGLALTLSSCDVLDVKPKDFLSPEQYYNTEEELNTALTGVYATFINSGTFLNNLGRLGLDADEVYNFRDLNAVSNYASSPSDTKILSYWREFYAGIVRANMLIKNVDKASGVPKAVRDVIKGEALFLRGFFYFNLVTNFGDVPLILDVIESSEASALQRPRTPAREVYEQIIIDMTQASEMVKDITEVGHGGRANKSAAYGMLARVNLYMAGNPINDVSKYEEVKKWAQKIIDNPIHNLNPSYQQIFVNYATDQYDIGESLFEIEFKGNGIGIFATLGGMVGTTQGIQNSTDEAIGEAYAYLYTTAYSNKIFDSERDLRKDWSISPFLYNNVNPATKWYPPSTHHFNRCIGKFRRISETLTPKHKGRTPQNFPILRYSDILLMYAEAENEINGPNNAYQYVNEVRRRGFGKLEFGENVKQIVVSNSGSGYTSAPTVSITGGNPTVAATATATVSGGKVTGVTVTNPGAFYSPGSTVTLSFAGGGGNGAVATVELTTPTDADLTPIQITDKNTFREVLQEERTRELAFENMRKSDLVRWGIFMKKMEESLNDAKAGPGYSTLSRAVTYFENASSRDVLWPIPSYEIGVNPLLKQNPGF